MSDPFQDALCGGSPRTVTGVASNSTNVTTVRTNTKTAESENYSQGPDKRSFSAQCTQTPSLFGGSSSTRAGKLVSTVPCSVTRASTSRRSLSDRLTPSLITAGLVRGITHTSIRSTCVQPEQVIVLSVPVGGDVDAPKVDCLCWSWLVNSGLFDHSEPAL